MIVYLDHNATIPVSVEVLEKVFDVITKPANPSSIHNYGRFAKGLVEGARKAIMNHLHIDAFEYDVIFTSSGTESNNHILKSLKDYHLFVPATEHASILRCSDLFENVVFLELDENGLVDLEKLEKIMMSFEGVEKKLFSIAYANNETGAIQNIKVIADIIHKNGGILHSDMVQAFGRISFDLKDLGVDLATISSHKIGGMQGAAAIIKKANIKLDPILHGGQQERGFRAGTENVYAIFSFGEAVKLLPAVINNYRDVAKLRDYLEESLLSVEPEIKIYSAGCKRLPNTSYLTMPGVPHQTQVMNFDLKGFCVSSGSACSSGVVKDSHVLEAIEGEDEDRKNAIRVSLGIDNTKEQIQAFIEAWKGMYLSLGKVREIADEVKLKVANL